MKPVEQQEARVRLFGVVNAWDPEGGLFAIAPDRMGFGVVCAPLSGYDAAMNESINGILNLSWPTGTILQFCMHASQDIEDRLHQFRAMRYVSDRGLLREITAQRNAYLRELTQRPIGRACAARLRQTRLYITASLPVGVDEPTAEKLSELRDLRQAFEASVKASRFYYETLTPEKYIRAMEPILNHDADAAWRQSPWGSYDSSMLVCNQLLDPGTDLDKSSRRQIKLGEHCVVRTLHPKRYPEHVWSGMAMRYVGDLMRGTRSIRDPFLITVNIIYPDHESKRGAMTRDLAWTQRQSEGPLAKLLPIWQQKRDSLRATLDRVDEGDRLIRAYIGVATFSENEERATQSSQDMQSLFRELGFQMMEDRFFVSELFSQLLPFAAEEAMEKASFRYRTLASSQLIPLLPIMGSWRGTGTPLMTLIARDGNLMCTSPNDTDGNMNVIVAAQSGMGKSFLANDLIMNYLSVGGRAWVIDKGFSYKPLTDLVDGQYIEFEKNVDLCLNPFPMVKDFEEEFDMLATIVEVMAAPKEGLDDFQRSGLCRVLAECWADKKHEMCIDDIATAMIERETDQRLKDVGHQLYSWRTGSVYGRYFNGPNNVDLSNRLVVLELKQLESRPHLMRVVLLQLMFQIQAAMESLPKSLPKLLLIDEAFNLIATDETAKFIETFYRQIRKQGGSAVICTQSVNDLYQTSGSTAIVENSAHMWLLGQKSESISLVKKSGRLEMPEAGFKLLESVHTVQGEYSEVLVKNAFGIGVGRLVVSDFNKLLYSTKASDVAQRKALMERGMSIEDAIKAMLHERSLDTRAVG